MPMPRPEICVTFDAVEKPGWNRHSTSCASVGSLSGARGPSATARSRTRSKSMPRAVVGELDRDFVADLAHRQRDLAGLGLARLRRASRASRCRGRARCAAGARADRRAFPAPSGRARSARRGFRGWRACRARCAVLRRIRYSRSDRLPNGTVRIANSRCWTSRDSRACASSAASASSRFFSSACWTVETSLTPSANERVSSWKRV